ncbi:D-alanine--D-alanine ligase [Candidatus Poribacteria bacterium]|nr:D-alanine--D-alanine ligase [Candidatus Poribacteria bacterium]
MKIKKIAVIMGGNSSEREISLLTGKAIANALKSKGYKVVCMNLDADLPENLKKENIQIAFNALHGPGGEDGCVQGMLDILGVKYTGSGVMASALAMNKIMAKRIFIASALPTPVYQIINKNQKKYKITLNFPIVVKPSSQGSACGVNIVSNNKELKDALNCAFKLDDEALLEKYIPGRELTVAVLGDKVLPIVEIVPNKKFYDYEAKYTMGMSKHIVPAKLSKELTKKIQKIAYEAHKSLGCMDYSRVDIRLNEKNEPYILEVNTLPGMTDLSLFPDAARSAGISFPDLIEKILKMATEHETRGTKDEGQC